MNVNSKGLISWFSRNPVAANLVMVLVFFAGAISLTTISKEMFPRSERNMISISVPYPGAAPVEVEKGVILPMESVLEGLQGIKKITSGADRDYGRIYLEIEASEDINDVLTQVENRIDSIVDLPDDMEKPTIKKLDGNIWAIGVVVYGELTKPERKALGDQVYDEVLALPEVKDLNLYGAGTYEISIEVKEDRLRELNLTLSEVANAVRVSSLDLPAGIIRSEAGNVLIRTEGKAYVGQDFENIVLRSQVDGTQLLLSDVAEVRDGFTDTIFLNHFDPKTRATKIPPNTRFSDIISRRP